MTKRDRLKPVPTSGKATIKPTVGTGFSLSLSRHNRIGVARLGGFFTASERSEGSLNAADIGGGDASPPTRLGMTELVQSFPRTSTGRPELMPTNRTTKGDMTRLRAEFDRKLA